MDNIQPVKELHESFMFRFFVYILSAVMILSLLFFFGTGLYLGLKTGDWNYFMMLKG